MTGHEFDLCDRRTALLTIGSIERHGNHLPLGTDSIIPQHIVDKASAKLNCIVLPPVFYGSCKTMRGFPGTFDMSSEIFNKYLQNIMMEADRNGVKLLCIVNGHGGNSTTIAMAAKEVSTDCNLAVLVIDWWKELGLEEAAKFTSPGHAGEVETSAMLAISPEDVLMEFAISHEVTYPRFKLYSKEIDHRIYSSALTGDAKRATREKGEALINAAISDLVDMVREAQAMLFQPKSHE